jgi:signal transduction histidine kinase
VVHILDETSQVLAASRALERKSRQLEAATTELRDANNRLLELDRLKDDFVSTVSHELANAADLDPGVFRDPQGQSRSRER